MTGLAANSRSKHVWIVGLDDTLRRATGGKFDSIAIPTTGQPRSVAASNSSGHVLVATNAGVDIITGESANKTHQLFNDGITAVACSDDGKYFALGREDSKVILCNLDNSANQLKEEAKLENGRSTITALAFSKNGKYLAAGESNGKINVYDVEEKKVRDDLLLDVLQLCSPSFDDLLFFYSSSRLNLLSGCFTLLASMPLNSRPIAHMQSALLWIQMFMFGLL